MSTPIIKFQIDHGLVPDGIIGRNTLAKMREVFQLDRFQLSHYLGQCHHETQGFTKTHESLNYSVGGLLGTFGFYKNRPLLAAAHGRMGTRPAEQITIANNVYDDQYRSRSYRLGNDEPGDGWKFRGRGPTMTTGKNNYHNFFASIGLCPDSDPELLATKYYWQSGLFYFENTGIFDRPSMSAKEATKKVQGAYRGLKERRYWTAHYQRLQA